MPKKTAKGKKITPWLSANRDGSEGRFIQLGNSFLDAELVQKLSGNAFRLYLCMVMESNGKRDFTFTRSTAKNYGLAETSFENAKKELENEGFIRRIYSLENSRTARGTYTFSLEWKGITENWKTV